MLLFNRENFGNLPATLRYITEIQIIVWGFTLLTMFRNNPVYSLLHNLIWMLRSYPIIWWAVIIVVIIYQIGRWIISVNPTPFDTQLIEHYRATTAIWSVTFILLFDIEDEKRIRAGQKLARSPLSGLMITVTMLASILMLTEFTLRWLPPMSDGGALTLMGKQWWKLHWNPVNNLGYRDYPLHEDVASEVSRILIAGDSFAAGHGVANFDDTFGQVLAQKCGSRCTVNSTAIPGFATMRQLQAVEEYPLSPDILVLSYMMNDIQDSVMGAQRVVTAIPPKSAIDYWRDEFYTGSLIWYIGFADNNYTSYYGQMFGGYEDEAIWQRHKQELQEFIDYAEREDAQLVVLLWHFIQFPDESRPGMTHLETFFTESNIPVINMLDELPYDSIPANQMVASPIDPHPGVISHRYAGEALFDLIQSLQPEL